MIYDEEMVGVREYAEGMPVRLGMEGERVVVVAKNEAGHNSTLVDLEDLVVWLRKNKMHLLM